MSKVKRYSVAPAYPDPPLGGAGAAPVEMILATDYDAALALLAEALENVVALDSLEGNDPQTDTLVIAIRELIDE